MVGAYMGYRQIKASPRSATIQRTFVDAFKKHFQEKTGAQFPASQQPDQSNAIPSDIFTTTTQSRPNGTDRWAQLRQQNNGPLPSPTQPSSNVGSNSSRQEWDNSQENEPRPAEPRLRGAVRRQQQSEQAKYNQWGDEIETQPDDISSRS